MHYAVWLNTTMMIILLIFMGVKLARSH
jgi:hypothetical protein